MYVYMPNFFVKSIILCILEMYEVYIGTTLELVNEYCRA